MGVSPEGGKGSGQRRQHNLWQDTRNNRMCTENQKPEDAAGNHGGRGLAGMKRGFRQGGTGSRGMDPGGNQGK